MREHLLLKDKKTTRLPSESDNKRLPCLLIYLMIVIIYACFQNVLNCGFVWDDEFTIVKNFHFRGFSTENIFWFFTTFYDANYHPACWISFALDYTLWGLHPAGYHLTSLMLHILNSILFFILVLEFIKIYKKETPIENKTLLLFSAATGTLFFAIHPLRVESVAWLSARGDLLCATFLIPTLIYYLKYVKSHGTHKTNYLLSVIFFSLSLLSRAWGMTFFVVLLIVDIYPLHRLKLKKESFKSDMMIISEKIPFFLLSLASAVLAFMAKTKNTTVLGINEYGMFQRFAQSAHGLCFYIWKMLFPVTLSPLYLFQKDFNPLKTKYILAIILFSIIIAVLIAVRKRLPYLPVVFSCYAIIVSPLIGIVQAGPQLTADRYTYIATMPFSIFLGMGLYFFCLRKKELQITPFRLKKNDLASPSQNNRIFFSYFLIIISAILILSFYFKVSFNQSNIWRNDLSLWSHVISIDPENNIAYWNRGLLMDKQKKYPQAMNDYSNAIKFNPNASEYYTNRGAIKKTMGDIKGAMEDFNAAIKINPKSPEPYANRATIYISQQNLTSATEDLRKALELSSENWCYREEVKKILDKINRE